MRSLGTIVLSIGTVAVFLIGLVNGHTVTFNLLGADVMLPSGVLLIVGYIIGFLCTFSLLVARYTSRSTSSEKLLQWQVQDEKLIAEVQSDREKQLQAKIATLEAALQRALKK